MANFYVQRGINPTAIGITKFPGNMHNYIWCSCYIPSFLQILLDREVMLTNFVTDARTDGQTNKRKTICLPTKVGVDMKIKRNRTCCKLELEEMSFAKYHSKTVVFSYRHDLPRADIWDKILNTIYMLICHPGQLPFTLYDVNFFCRKLWTDYSL